MPANVKGLIFPLLTALVCSSVAGHAGDRVALTNGRDADVATAIRLSDTQMDRVTAGQVLGIECPGCTLASSNSMSTNGVTISMTSTGVTPGGGGGGTGGSSGGGGGSSGPSIVTSAPTFPANIAAAINAATTISVP